MDIVLENGEIVCIDGDARNLSIACQAGKLWITQPGDPNDYTLLPGERFMITRKGKIAVTGLGDARVSFTAQIEFKKVSHPWQALTA